MTVILSNVLGGGGKTVSGGTGGVSDHNLLNNLDFPSAGHTGDLDLGANKLSAAIVTSNTIYAGILTASTVLATTVSASTLLATTCSATIVLATTTSATTMLATTLSGTTLYATTVSATNGYITTVSSNTIKATIFTGGTIYSVISSANTLKATTVTCSNFYSTTVSVIQSGADPTVSVAGQIAVDVTTTSGSVFRFFSDTECVLPAYQSKSFAIIAPVLSTYGIWRVPYNITLRDINCLLYAGASTSLTGALYEGDGDGINLVVATVEGAILGAVNTGSNISNASIDAGDYLVWSNSASSGVGAINQLIVTMDYTVDTNT